MTGRATAVLHAFACSDLVMIDQLCADDVLVWGTDDSEAWEGKNAVVAAFAGAFDLRVRWVGEPALGDDWVAGLVEFDAGTADLITARVTMVFRGDLLAHAHYSIAVAAPQTPGSAAASQA